ncbi:hypothetical protein Mal15_37970 [Stieleria maiorica]|uniref:Uncharacterized protein n=1 Tax=Stieleria maiorica TaxID=2795974 RepID=A0A5B9MEP0_9BACT|nr:hypothetical protein Mal15_37970 [Stieleria maiorica]
MQNQNQNQNLTTRGFDFGLDSAYFWFAAGSAAQRNLRPWQRLSCFLRRERMVGREKIEIYWKISFRRN